MPTIPARFRPGSLSKAGQSALTALLCAFLASLAVHAVEAASAPETGAQEAVRRVQDALRDVDPGDGSVLLDRGLPLTPVARLDGSPAAPAIGVRELRQIGADLARAARPGELRGDPDRLRERGHSAAKGLVPIAIVDVRTSRIRPDANRTGDARIEAGRVRLLTPEALARGRLVAAAPLADRTWHGASTEFVVSGSHLLTSDGAPREIEIDFDDGNGFRPVSLDDRMTVAWGSTGTKRIRVRFTASSGEKLQASSGFAVRSLAAPAPHDTLAITASQSWQGIAGTGEAYVYLAPGHVDITDPVVVIEGFDIEDSMNWEELYELLNQENLIEDLRADGYDAVVLNFTSATEPMPRNGFVAVELIEQVKARIAPTEDLFVIGASMGGLVGRWALSWMEQQGIDHRARTFLAFDTPHAGADIPLGIQFWLDFFSGLSADAEFLLGRLDTPAARQMLVLHHSQPDDGTPEADPLRAQFLADLAAVGDWPSQCRTVAVANGTASGFDQGFAPGTQVIVYDFQSILVDILGNVWALPTPGTSGKIFDGKIDYLFGSDSFRQVFVDPPKAWDGAPGGWRATMAEMDSVSAPFGDIVALHDNHCFIPTISSLALETEDLDYDVAGDPDLLAITPVDAVYFPTGANQEHISITPESAAWFRLEIGAGAVDVPTLSGATGDGLVLAPPFPNPSAGSTIIRFSTRRAGPVQVVVHDVAGRLVTTLWDDRLAAGSHELPWTAPSASGVYLVRVQTANESEAARVVVLQ